MLVSGVRSSCAAIEMNSALHPALALELGVLRAQLRLGLGERARALANDLIEVRAQRAELGARGLDLARALLEHVAEADRGVEQLGLGRRRRASALEPRDQHVDRALRRGELVLELGDPLVAQSRAHVAARRSRAPVSVWLTSSIPVCSPKLWNPIVGYVA